MTANQDQRELWNGESGRRWVAAADRRDEVLAPVADALFDAAALQPGERVLDIGCGCGATTIRAGELTGAPVVGVDLSATMLEVARARVGSRPIEFVEADVQTHHFEADAFDVAISRFGTMFFNDPVAAFAGVRGALSADGRLCIVTWQPLEANEWLFVIREAIAAFATIPPVDPSAPGMFNQSEPGAIRRVLGDAGWRDITVEPVAVQLCVGARTDDAVDYLANGGPVRASLETVAPNRYDDAIAAIRTVVAARVTAAGVTLGGAINVTRARK